MDIRSDGRPLRVLPEACIGAVACRPIRDLAYRREWVETLRDRMPAEAGLNAANVSRTRTRERLPSILLGNAPRLRTHQAVKRRGRERHEVFRRYDGPLPVLSEEEAGRLNDVRDRIQGQDFHEDSAWEI